MSIEIKNSFENETFGINMNGKYTTRVFKVTFKGVPLDYTLGFYSIKNVETNKTIALYDCHPGDNELALTSVSCNSLTPGSITYFLNYTIDPCIPKLYRTNSLRTVQTNVDKDGNPLKVSYLPKGAFVPIWSLPAWTQNWMPADQIRIVKQTNTSNVPDYSSFEDTINDSDFFFTNDRESWLCTGIHRKSVVNELGKIGFFGAEYSSSPTKHLWFIDTFDFEYSPFWWRKYLVHQDVPNHSPSDIDQIIQNISVTSGNGWKAFNMYEKKSFDDLKLFANGREP